MARRKNEDRTIEAGQQGGVSNEQIKHVSKSLREAQEAAADYNQSANEEVKAFGEKGGDKAAIRLVTKLSKMEVQKAQAFLRALDHYSNVMGIWDQGDMFDAPPAAHATASGVGVSVAAH